MSDFKKGDKVKRNPSAFKNSTRTDEIGIITCITNAGFIDIKWAERTSAGGYKPEELILVENTVEANKAITFKIPGTVVTKPDIGDSVSINPNATMHNTYYNNMVGKITQVCFNDIVNVKWQNGDLLAYKLGNLVYAEQPAVTGNAQFSLKKGDKVVRDPINWVYGSQDCNGDQPSIGVITSCDGAFRWVKWENGNELIHRLDSLIKLNNLSNFKEGIKVVRNPLKWIHGEQDHHEGKPSIGVIVPGLVSDGYINVRWENGRTLVYKLDRLSYYESDMFLGLVDNISKSEIKLNGNNVIVPSILPTIKNGKIPSSKTLIPKVKKAIVIKSNLQFREVVV